MNLVDKIFERIGYVPKLRLDNEKKIKDSLEEQLKKVQVDLEEFEKLAGICLTEKKEFEDKYKELKDKINGDYGKHIRILAELDDLQIKVLQKFVPKQISQIDPDTKIHYQKIHLDPKGFSDFLLKLSKCEYIHEINTGDQINTRKTCFDKIISKENNVFIIEGHYVTNHFGKKVYIHTTATNKNEALFIRCLLNEKYSK